MTLTELWHHHGIGPLRREAIKRRTSEVLARRRDIV